MAPVTPPKASSPVKPVVEAKAAPPAKAEEAKASGVKPQPTPRSPPPPTGISSPSSPTSAGREKSPGESSRKEEESKERSKTRSPLARRPHGTKQRRKFAQGKFGDMRVKFADPIDNREKGGKKGKGRGKHKGKGDGKGKSKGKKGKPRRDKKASQGGGSPSE